MDESSNDTAEHFRLQRRNTFICSLIIILYYAGNMHFSEISVLGNKMEIGAIKIPALFLIYLTYTAMRYYQACNAEGVFRTFFYDMHREMANGARSRGIIQESGTLQQGYSFHTFDGLSSPIYAVQVNGNPAIFPLKIFKLQGRDAVIEKELNGYSKFLVIKSYSQGLFEGWMSYIFKKVFFFEKIFPFFLIIGAYAELFGLHWTGLFLGLASSIAVPPKTLPADTLEFTEPFFQL